MAEGSDDIQALVGLMARLPGLGPRSARRIVLHLIRKRSGQMSQLAGLLDRVAINSRECVTCGNITDRDECAICADPARATLEGVGHLSNLEAPDGFSQALRAFLGRAFLGRSGRG